MTKAVGIIPARWGSTRFPGKALHSIAGKPLLRHVWERCQRAKKLERVIIATDDFRIAEAAFDWGAEVAMTSPNHASGTDRIAEVAAKLKAFTHIINIQGDEPLVDPKLIDRLVRTLQADRPEDVATEIRKALRFIPAERLIVSSDCGFGRQGCNREIAFYKASAIAQGCNIIRRELGLPVTYVPAADPSLQVDVVPGRDVASIRLSAS